MVAETRLLICACPDKNPGCMLGSPMNPVWEVGIQFTDHACATPEMIEELGCPCDCHKTVDAETGEPLLSWCSFCPVKHELK